MQKLFKSYIEEKYCDNKGNEEILDKISHLNVLSKEESQEAIGKSEKLIIHLLSQGVEGFSSLCSTIGVNGEKEIILIFETYKDRIRSVKFGLDLVKTCDWKVLLRNCSNFQKKSLDSPPKIQISSCVQSPSLENNSENSFFFESSLDQLKSLSEELSKAEGIIDNLLL